jgi:hypothetical protein
MEGKRSKNAATAKRPKLLEARVPCVPAHNGPLVAMTRAGPRSVQKLVVTDGADGPCIHALGRTHPW